MNTRHSRIGALAAGVVALMLGFAVNRPALAIAMDPVTITVKIFNYSRFPFELTGKPVRGQNSGIVMPLLNFSIPGNSAPSKGQQAILNKPITLGQSGEGGQDILLTLNVNYNGTPTKCFAVLAYARRTTLNVKTGSYNSALGADNATAGCAGGPWIKWQTSQNDIEIVIDPDRKSWAPASAVDPIWICRELTPEQKMKNPMCIGR
jgi:hypothetical protein